MRCRAFILPIALLVSACGSREAEAPQSPEEAAREYEAELKSGLETAETSSLDAQPATPEPYATECAIDWRGERYVDRCMYYPQAEGSFALTREAGGNIVPGTASIGVFANPDGSAIVSGTGPDGRAVRWGIAQRAPQNDDCWEGDGFWVCAG